jgi:hypothetical protein
VSDITVFARVLSWSFTVKVVFSLVSTAQYLYVAWTEYLTRSLPECLGKPELHNLLKMYPLVWYDLTREQHSRSRGRVEDSIILTKERRRGREIPDYYGASARATM